MAVNSEVTMSSKGQIILPKDLRERLGIRQGDKLKLELDEKSKTILLRPRVEPPQEVFVRAGTKLTSSILKDSDNLDSSRTKRLLKAIGIKE